MLRKTLMLSIHIVLLLVYFAGSMIATGLIGGGGHGSLAPFYAMGSWIFVGLRIGVRLFSANGDGPVIGVVLHTALLFFLLALVIFYYVCLLRLLNQSRVRARITAAFHLCGTMTAAYLADLGASGIPGGNISLGRSVSLILVSAFLLLVMAARWFASAKRDSETAISVGHK